MAVDWTDLGVVLSVVKHGEHDVILHALTEHHGHHAGVVKGGAGRRSRGLYQPGNRLQLRWRARLADHLGTYTCEPERQFAAAVLDSRPQLAALSAVCAMAESVLPEREAHPLAYRQTCHLLEMLAVDVWDAATWGADYVLWEMHLLNELGFGLDLSSCASTGATEDLIYVSPKSGRAVSRAAGVPYKAQLLPLPPFLVREDHVVSSPDEVTDGLDLTGYFLERHVIAQGRNALPDARARLRSVLAGAGTPTTLN